MKHLNKPRLQQSHKETSCLVIQYQRMQARLFEVTLQEGEEDEAAAFTHPAQPAAAPPRSNESSSSG